MGAAGPDQKAEQVVRRRRVRAVLLAAIGLLYLFSVPWYRSTEQPLEIWLGLPDWVTVAVGCYAAVAVLNSFAWLLTDVRDDGPLPEGLRSDEGRRP